MLLPRFITGLIGIPLLLFLVWLGSLPFFFTVFTIIFLCLWEFYTLCEEKGYYPNKFFGVVFGLILYLSFYLNKVKMAVPFVNEGTAALFTLIIIIYLSWALITAVDKDAYIDHMFTLWGIIYISWLLGHLVLIRELRPWGMEYTYMLLLTAWISDTVAYGVGSRYGFHKLLSKISAMKSWEGSISGLITSVIVVLIFKGFFIYQLSYGQAITLGIILGIGGQLGDLAESFFKRFIGVKDSSVLLPGHGGMLDRFDTIMFTAPLLYYFLRFVAK